MIKDLLTELKERGLIEYTAESCENNLKDFFSPKNRKNKGVYTGADPSAKSLHLGNYATYIVIKWLAKEGYPVYSLVGGITGLIGDPRDPIFSGSDAKERDLTEIKTIEENVKCISKQFKEILKSKNVINNLDFYKNMSVWEYLREIGKRINVNYILAKDTVARRLENGISYAEFSYNLLQGWDWTTMYFDGMKQKKYVKHQMVCQFGGGDQWGNITTGLEFIRKKCNELNIENKACCFGIKLYLKPDGTKFGKTASGAVWLDEKMTSNYSFYQYLFNQPDDAIKSLLYRFTLLPRKEIDEIMKLHEKEPFKRIGQRKLAYVITKDVRGEKGLKEALEVSRILFSGSLEESSVDLQKKVVDHIPNKVFLKGKKEIGIIDVLIQSNICKSSSEARKLIEQKAIKYDNQIITDIKYVFKNSNKIEFIKKGVRIYIVLDWKK